MFAEDMSAFFDSDGLADGVVFNSVPIVAVAGEKTVFRSEITGAITEQVLLTGKTADIGANVVGQSVVVDGITWHIINKEIDSAFCSIMLERVKS